MTLTVTVVGVSPGTQDVAASITGDVAETDMSNNTAAVSLVVVGSDAGPAVNTGGQSAAGGLARELGVLLLGLVAVGAALTARRRVLR